MGELQDCVNGTPVVPRVSRSEAAFDIRSQRKLAVDEPFTVAETSRPLLAASWRVQAPAPAARCRGAPTRVGSRCRAAGAATARLSDTGQPASGRGWQPNLNGTPVVPRVSRSEAAFDIRSQRKLAADEPFTVAETSRPLLAASWRVQAPAPAARCRGAPTRVGSRCRAAGAATARLSDTGQPASGRRVAT